MPALGAGGLVFISSRDFVRGPLFLPVPTPGSLAVEGSPFLAKGTQPVSLQLSKGRGERSLVCLLSHNGLQELGESSRSLRFLQTCLHKPGVCALQVRSDRRGEQTILSPCRGVVALLLMPLLGVLAFPGSPSAR